MSLAPEIVKQLADQKAAGLPQVWEAPVAILREQTQARVTFAGVPEPIYQVINRFIPGPTSDLPIRIYRPSNKNDLPAIVFFHGGGWVLNFLDIYDAALHRLANQSCAVIISVNYQKAPEHPFPIPFDDCFATLQWVKSNAAHLGVARDRIGVAGDSAGGNLAAAVALKARDLNIEITFQLLIYPCTERNFDTPAYRDFANDFGLTTRAMQWFWQQYLADGEFESDAYAQPARANSFHALAPTIIITAQYDPLISDSITYAEKLRAAGIDVTYRDFPGMIHGFFANLASTPSAQEAIDFAALKIVELNR
jgi:acetyl esterase